METVRLNVNLPEDQAERLDKLVPWGIRAQLVRSLLDGFERAFQKEGFKATGAIIAGQFDICLTGDGSDVSKFETPCEESTSGPTTP